ncbi:MAG: hypothetical protein WCI37_02290 [bacterium]
MSNFENETKSDLEEVSNPEINEAPITPEDVLRQSKEHVDAGVATDSERALVEGFELGASAMQADVEKPKRNGIIHRARSFFSRERTGQPAKPRSDIEYIPSRIIHAEWTHEEEAQNDRNYIFNQSIIELVKLRQGDEAARSTSEKLEKMEIEPSISVLNKSRLIIELLKSVTGTEDAKRTDGTGRKTGTLSAKLRSNSEVRSKESVQELADWKMAISDVGNALSTGKSKNFENQGYNAFLNERFFYGDTILTERNVRDSLPDNGDPLYSHSIEITSKIPIKEREQITLKRQDEETDKRRETRERNDDQWRI